MEISRQHQSHPWSLEKRRSGSLDSEPDSPWRGNLTKADSDPTLCRASLSAILPEPVIRRGSLAERRGSFVSLTVTLPTSDTSAGGDAEDLRPDVFTVEDCDTLFDVGRKTLASVRPGPSQLRHVLGSSSSTISASSTGSEDSFWLQRELQLMEDEQLAMTIAATTNPPAPPF